MIAVSGKMELFQNVNVAMTFQAVVPLKSLLFQELLYRRNIIHFVDKKYLLDLLVFILKTNKGLNI